MTAPDPRLYAYRPDLADRRLRGKVEAARYVAGEPGRIVAASAGLRSKPDAAAGYVTEALMGESLVIFDEAGEWTWVQLDEDGYVGYVPAATVARGVASTTHRVAVPSTLLFPEPNLKSQPATPAYLHARLEIVRGNGHWAELADGRHVFARHLMELGTHLADPPGVAERFISTPYLWGGKTIAGIDCSGLVQLAWLACGVLCPRDSDMQERSFGEVLPMDAIGALRRGDLVFWNGHVGIMLDGERLIHANGHHMMTVIEPLAETVARIAAMHGPVTALRRPPR